MALELDTQYHRIMSIILSYSAKTSQIQMSVYVDEAARIAGDLPIVNKTYFINESTPATFTSLFAVGQIDPLGENPVKLFYDHLKTLTEYSAATDV